MIKGIILDVDGVITGGKKGYNWPQPHPEVIKALSNLRKHGVIVSFCTGRGTFAIKEIVEAAHLNNPHIGDGGAVVIDFINHKVMEKHIIEKELSLKVINTYLKENVYLELYDIEGYYVQQNQIGEITQKHKDILHSEPQIVDSLLDAAKNLELVKIMTVPKDEQGKEKVIALSQPFKNKLSLQWGIHPTALPAFFGYFTAPNISKKHAVLTIANYAKISPEEMLGVGDGLSDWNFMQLCQYVGVMGNASEDLRKVAQTKGKNCFIGPSVDENGLLAIFRHFGLTNMVY